MNPITTIADEMDALLHQAHVNGMEYFHASHFKKWSIALRALAAPVAETYQCDDYFCRPCTCTRPVPADPEFSAALDAYVKAAWADIIDREPFPDENRIRASEARATVERLYAQAAQAVKVPDELEWRNAPAHYDGNMASVWASGGNFMRAETIRLNTPNAKEGS